MTPEERQLISGLFDRMRQQGALDKDRDAEALINDLVRQMPDTPYMMVQSVLVQEMALQNAQAQVEALDERVRSLESEVRAQQQPQGASQGSGSFLGGLFGGGTARPAASGSVPMVGRGTQSAGFGGSAAGDSRSPWGNAPGMPAQAQRGMAPSMAQQPMQQAGAGGGFMRSALTTAAGVAGGMLAANAISGMFKGDTAHAAQPPASGATPAAETQVDHNDDPLGDDDGSGYDSGDDAGDDELGFDDGGDWGSE